MAIRILLVASSLPLSTAVQTWLERRQDFKLLDAVRGHAAALAEAARLAPDVLLLDASGQPTGVLPFLTRAGGLPGPPRVLILAAPPAEALARQWRAAGAAGWLDEHCTEAELAETIRTVAAGGLVLDPRLPRHTPPSAGAPGLPNPRTCLSERELEIFWLTGEGLEAKEIAARLGLSPRTVDVHRANIRAKLGLKGAHDLMRHALHWADRERVQEQLSRFCLERRPLLLVEDDEVDVLSVRRALRELGTETRLVVAGHGEEALAYLRDPDNIRPFLILLDISLPRMDGPEFLAELRADPRLAGLPVVVLTSSSRLEDIERLHRLGVTGYLVKPTESARFLEMFRSLALYWGVNRTPGLPPASPSGTTQGTWLKPPT